MTIIKKTAYFVAVIFCLILIAPTDAHAFRIYPMNQTIELGRGTTAEIIVENVTEKPLTVEFMVEKRNVDDQGNENHTSGEDDFVIFPPQTVIQPESSQKIRVQYVGDPSISQSESYHIYAAQVPVNLSNVEKSGVSTVLKMGASLHVAPPDTKPSVSITEVRAKGNDALVTIQNNGGRFAYIDDVKITLSGGNASKEYEGEELVQLAVRTLIPPGGGTRTITLPMPEGASGASPQAQIEMIDD
jgi:P pilus assembly chaperone PapD